MVDWVMGDDDMTITGGERIMKTKHWIFLVLMALLLLSACEQQTMTTVVSDMPVSEGLDTTETTPAAPVAEGRTVVADGRLASPYPNLALGFGGGVSGQVITLTVKAGDKVAAGDVIARLDTADLQRAVENAELALARAQNDRERAQVQWERDVQEAEQAIITAQRAITSTILQGSNTNIEEARTVLERARKTEDDAWKTYQTPLFGEWTPDDVKQNNYNAWQAAVRERELAQMRLNDAVDAQRVRGLDQDSRESDLAQAERKLAALQDGLAPTYARAIEDAERELQKAQDALPHATLVAPWPALVLSLNVAPKAQVAAGSPVVTLLSLEDGLRFVTQNLSEQHVATIRPGQPASVTLRTFPETPLAGTVEAIVPQTETQNATDARFAVHIRLAPTDLNLLPGLTGRVEILTED